MDSCKPNFQDDGGLPLYMVDPEDDSLSLVQNDVGQSFHHEYNKENGAAAVRGNNIFQGGNWQHLHAMLGLKSGEKVSRRKHYHNRLHSLPLLLITQFEWLIRTQMTTSPLWMVQYYYGARYFLLVIMCLLISRDQNDTLDGEPAWLSLNFKQNLQCNSGLETRRMN